MALRRALLCLISVNTEGSNTPATFYSVTTPRRTDLVTTVLATIHVTRSVPVHIIVMLLTIWLADCPRSALQQAGLGFHLSTPIVLPYTYWPALPGTSPCGQRSCPQQNKSFQMVTGKWVGSWVHYTKAKVSCQETQIMQNATCGPTQTQALEKPPEFVYTVWSLDKRVGCCLNSEGVAMSSHTRSGFGFGWTLDRREVRLIPKDVTVRIWAWNDPTILYYCY